MKKQNLIIFSLVFCFLFDFVDPQIRKSPCPNYFQYGLLKGKVVGSTEISIPRTKVYGFKVTQLFIPLVEEITGVPKLQLMNKDKPREIIENILFGEKLHFVTEYPQSNSDLEFKLIKIMLNDEVLCEDEKPNPNDNRLVYRATENFEIPPNIISTYKEFFPVEFNEDHCGMQRNQEPGMIDTFITLSKGAEKAEWKDFPWVASVFINGEYECTANLISKNTAICAAHCFDGNVSHKNVLLGLFNKKNATIWGYLKHQDHFKYRNDLALIFLESDITDSGFSPLCLWHFDMNLNEKSGLMVSLGETESGDTNRLHQIALNTVSNQNCKASSPELNDLVEDNHFCAGNRDGSGPCSGDSGAGLLMQYGNKWYLRGILSASLKDKETDSCDNYNYAIFVDVLKYLSWISSEHTAKSKGPMGYPEITENCGNIETRPTKENLRAQDQTWAVRGVWKDSNSYLYCALIKPNWVIATAILLYNQRAENLKVVTMNGLEIDAEKIIVHEKYSSSDYYKNDVALIKLKSSFPPSIKPVCLDRTHSQSHSSDVYSMFWDVFNATLMSREECGNKLNTKTYKLEDSYFCVRPTPPTTQLARLIFDLHKTPDGKTYWAHLGQTGVFSSDYGAHTDFSYFIDWIKDTINKN